MSTVPKPAEVTGPAAATGGVGAGAPGGGGPRIGVLGPVTAWDGAGRQVALRGPRHRAVLARLIVARGRVVPVGMLVDDLWTVPPRGAVSSIRTFVAALRRALEPDRAPRAQPCVLVTEGPGYALRVPAHALDASRFEAAVTAANAAARAGSRAPVGAAGPADLLEEALGWWRGPAYADFPDAPWAHAERSRLTELRLRAVEMQATAHLSQDRAELAIPTLDAHVTEHPWREEGWRLLALALYRAGRQGDALAVLRRARHLLNDTLGIDPGPALAGLETDMLRHEPHLDPPRDTRAPLSPALDPTSRPSRAGPRSTEAAPRPDQAELPGDPSAEVWAATAATYDRLVRIGTRARLESTVTLLRSLAVTSGDGLHAARAQRLATIAAAEQSGDPALTARVIGAYDVPAIWTRSDDPTQAAAIVAAARRTLSALPGTTARSSQAAPPATTAGPLGSDVVAGLRARLLATIALETRGSGTAEDLAAAREAERTARRLQDPVLLVFALNAVFMQSFHRTGLSRDRDAIGAELIDVATRNGLVTAEILGHLIRLQSRSAVADFPSADRHAAAVDALADSHELPLGRIFTRWYRALRLAAGPAPADTVEREFRSADTALEGAGMPGLRPGLLSLASLGLRIRDGRPAEASDYGPYQPWVDPLLAPTPAAARAALRRQPEPPRDHLAEALWCLTARAATRVDDRATMALAREALLPAAGELAGAASGLVTFGPVTTFLTELDAGGGRQR